MRYPSSMEGKDRRRVLSVINKQFQRDFVTKLSVIPIAGVTAFSLFLLFFCMRLVDEAAVAGIVLPSLTPIAR